LYSLNDYNITKRRINREGIKGLFELLAPYCGNMNLNV
jgi:hypothetical protein